MENQLESLTVLDLSVNETTAG